MLNLHLHFEQSIYPSYKRWYRFDNKIADGFRKGFADTCYSCMAAGRLQKQKSLAERGFFVRR
jgi:hypothetical protein